MNNEDIKILEELIAGAKAYGEYEGNKYFESMEHLIAKNKKLEEENKTITDEYMIQKHLINADFLEDYIPKSKVREKIEELRNEEYDDITFKYNKIEVNGIIEVVLEELLED